MSRQRHQRGSPLSRRGCARQSRNGLATCRNQRGSGTVLVMAAMLIAAMMAFVSACLIAWFGCAHHARAAADLASLAGATAYAHGEDACTAARLTAQHNAAQLTACSVDSNGYDFIVAVSVRVPASPHTVFGPDHFDQTSKAGNTPP